MALQMSVLPFLFMENDYFVRNESINQAFMSFATSPLMVRLLKSWLRAKSRKSLPQLTGDLELKGLGSGVEIRRDGRGVPYIYAANRADLFFAQGFVHAQDRLWQMEVNRRLANGRLSEVLGKGALDTDRVSRTLGFNRLAKADAALVTADMRAHVQSYCDGVNASIECFGKHLPEEFALLKYKPEPWKPEDAFAFTRLMTLQLSSGWGHEIARAKLIEALGPEIAAEFDMRYHPDNPTVLPTGNERNFREADGRLSTLEQGPFFRMAGGSNAWAVAGSHTDTGKPYLCNDPHLSMLMPSIWYQIYMEAPDYRVQGVSIPGMPLVMIGHNSHVSWGITLAFTDIQDVFIEQFVDETHYMHKGKRLQAELYEERIKVKGEADHVEKVLETRNGPVVSASLSLPIGKEDGYHYALKSPGLRPSRLTMGWYGLNQAGNWNDFIGSARFIDAPGLNLVYADVEGNIGYWVTGKTPVRAGGKGEVPQPAWTGESDWKGWVPFEEMPHALNPKRGWLVSANHKIVGDDFPHFMGDIWMNGYRAHRIEELLSKKQKWSRDDFFPLHMDFYCKPGKDFAELFRDQKLQLSPTGQEAADRLLAWDGMLTAESVAGSIYEVARKAMVRILMRTAGGQETPYDWAVGKGVHDVFFKVCEFQGKETNALLEIIANPGSKVLQNAGGRAEVLTRSLEEAVQYLKKELGGKLKSWQWGRLHQVSFRHAMTAKPPFGKVFNTAPRPIGGDTDTVHQASMQPDQGFAANLALPSYRQVIDLSDFNNSVWVVPPGQSGQLGSPHREDQMEAWMNGAYFPMLWDKDKVVEASEAVLQLRPQPPISA